ncbi:MAG: hypothetical protein KGN34_14585 [Sphingomonadales bacterium]|nr:hypothetical protein [Sphingomonadales bacterium]
MFANYIIKPAALAIAATAFTVPALAHADEVHAFVRDGISYEYKTHDYGSSRVITGSADSREFRLVVKNGLVHGDFNGRPVQFKVADATAGPVLAVK